MLRVEIALTMHEKTAIRCKKERSSRSYPVLIQWRRIEQEWLKKSCHLRLSRNALPLQGLVESHAVVFPNPWTVGLLRMKDVKTIFDYLSGVVCRRALVLCKKGLELKTQ
jgi:hypothetical protein